LDPTAVLDGGVYLHALWRTGSIISLIAINVASCSDFSMIERPPGEREQHADMTFRALTGLNDVGRCMSAPVSQAGYSSRIYADQSIVTLPHLAPATTASRSVHASALFRTEKFPDSSEAAD